MADTLTGVNPQILQWARVRAGYSINQAAQKLGRDATAVEEWEAGTAFPTYAQLEKAAHDVYKLPLAVFFFPEPPVEETPEQSFRASSELQPHQLSPDTRFHIRKAGAFQLSLQELFEGQNPAQRLIFRDITCKADSDADVVAAEVREYLGITADIQRNVWRKVDDALTGWRRAIESVGVFVFKDSIQQKDVSGFCLYDTQFPLIYLNNSTTKARQVFTLIHELGHILLRLNGITSLSHEVESPHFSPVQGVEAFCNRFAAEVLMPKTYIHVYFGNRSPSPEEIQEIARSFKVSRDVVSRRLRDLGNITAEYYSELASRFAAEFQSKQQKSGGSHYATKATYLSERYTHKAFDRYNEHRISIEQLADYLSMKVRHIPTMESYLSGRGGWTE